MINTKCVLQNPIDKYTKETWPTKMAVRPLKGDWVESASGDKVLQVMSVTHATLTVPVKGASKLCYTKIQGLKVRLGLKE